MSLREWVASNAAAAQFLFSAVARLIVFVLDLSEI
jgi:hypothetical protein